MLMPQAARGGAQAPQQPQGGGNMLMGVPRGQALLTLGSNLLAANAPSLQPQGGTMARLGQAMQQTVPQLNQMAQQRIRNKLLSGEMDLKERQTKLAEEEHKLARQARDEVSQRAGRILKGYRQQAMQDNVLSPKESQAMQMLSVAEVSGDPGDLQKAIETLQPERREPQSPLGKLAADARAGFVPQEALERELAPERQDPYSDIAKLQADLQAGRISQDQYETAVEILRKPLVSMGQQEPLGSDAPMWLNEAGEPAPAMMTAREASALGYTPRTKGEVEQRRQVREAAPMVGRTIAFGLGEGGESLFPPDDANWAQRLLSGATAKWAQVTQDPTRPELQLYTRNKNATLSSLARLSGETGVLTDQDVSRVADLWPTPGVTPRSIAERQFRDIVGMLKSKGISGSRLAEMGFPDKLINAGSGSGNGDDAAAPQPPLRGAPAESPAGGAGGAYDDLPEGFQ